MRTNRRLLALVVAAVALLTHAPAAVGHSFLWRATGKGVPGGVVYLAGSVHMLSQDYYPLNAAVERAFKESDLLVEEVDLNEMLAPASQVQTLMRGMLPAGQSLDKLLSPATLALVNKFTAGLGDAAEPLKRFKPWMLAIAIEGLELQKSGFDPNLGLDKHFYDQARSDAKQVQGLETVAFQVSRFDGMTLEEQDRLLAETLKERSDIVLEGQRSAHTSKHKLVDVLMSNGTVWCTGGILVQILRWVLPARS